MQLIGSRQICSSLSLSSTSRMTFRGWSRTFLCVCWICKLGIIYMGQGRDKNTPLAIQHMLPVIFKRSRFSPLARFVLLDLQHLVNNKNVIVRLKQDFHCVCWLLKVGVGVGSGCDNNPLAIQHILPVPLPQTLGYLNWAVRSQYRPTTADGVLLGR